MTFLLPPGIKVLRYFHLYRKYVFPWEIPVNFNFCGTDFSKYIVCDFFTSFVWLQLSDRIQCNKPAMLLSQPFHYKGYYKRNEGFIRSLAGFALEEVIGRFSSQ